MPRRPARKGSNDHSRAPEVLDAMERKKLELDPARDAWDQQPGEVPRNFGLFQMYRDHGRLRSVAQLAGMHAVMTYTSMARIARFNRWAERAALWDAEQDRITAIRLQDAREDMARRHLKAAGSLMEKALARLLTLSPDDISPHALILMIDTAAKIERAALGLETLNKGASSTTTVTVAASTKTDQAGKPEVRVEVGVQHDRIMATLDAMVQRMSPEQIAAGYEELTASAEEATRELDAALPSPPPPGP
jgi:hypothetical protein